MGGKCSKADFGRDNLALALAKLPCPIRPFEDGAPCPWCAWFHTSVIFGDNICSACDRKFQFGQPDWGDGYEVLIWVEFPHQFYELGGSHELLEDWKPNKHLKEIYELQKDKRRSIEKHTMVGVIH